MALKKKHYLCYLLCHRKYLMPPLSLQDRYAGDCGWHCPAEPLVIDTTKAGSKSFLKGAWSKQSNAEHKGLLLRVKGVKTFPPWAQCDHPSLTHWGGWQDMWGFLYKDTSPTCTLNARPDSCGVLWFGGHLLCVFSISLNLWGNRQRHKTEGFGLSISYSRHVGWPAVAASPMPERFPQHPPLSSKARILPLHRGTRKLHFLCKALTHNSTSYESTTMTPIRNDCVNDN